MATTKRQIMTAEELLHLPDDGLRYELVRGELRTMLPTGRPHGRIAVKVTWPLAQFVEAHGLGEVYAAETGFKLTENPDTVRAPDVSFVRHERLVSMDDEGYLCGAPDLTVEVLSPSDRPVMLRPRSPRWPRMAPKVGSRG